MPLRREDLAAMEDVLGRGSYVVGALSTDDPGRAWDDALSWTYEAETLLDQVFGSVDPWLERFVQATRGYEGREPNFPELQRQPPLMFKSNVDRGLAVFDGATRTARRLVRVGPPPRDPLLEARDLSEANGITHVAKYIDSARDEYGEGNWETAAGFVGRAFERTVHALTGLVSGDSKTRDLRSAIQVLVSHDVIKADTAKALWATNVGAWGWICIKGRHVEGATAGTPAEDPAEAQYALDWIGGAVRFLVTAYVRWRDEQQGITE